jgi:twitching motility protein PilT
VINQREVGVDTASFAGALRDALREDPDVILVGEMRDLETISNAMTAAETGHLVFSTLHTSDVAQTVDRIIDVFPPHQQPQIRTQLAGCLQGIISQTLLKRKDGSGRIAAFEIMAANSAIRNLIKEAKTQQIYNVVQTSRQENMQLLQDSLKNLVQKDIITKEEAMTKLSNIKIFEQILKA